MPAKSLKWFGGFGGITSAARTEEIPASSNASRRRIQPARKPCGYEAIIQKVSRESREGARISEEKRGRF
jgi:hypothetical protein